MRFFYFDTRSLNHIANYMNDKIDLINIKARKDINYDMTFEAKNHL